MMEISFSIPDRALVGSRAEDTSLMVLGWYSRDRQLPRE